MHKSSLTAIYLSILTGCFAADAWAQRLDVSLKEGRNIRGEFRQSSPDLLTLENEQIPADKIRNVAVQDEPSELRQTRKRFEDARFDDGLNDLTKITDKIASKVVEQEIDFLRAFGSANSALSGGNVSPTDAISLCTDFARRYPNSYRLYPILELHGNLLAMTGADREAIEIFQKLNESQSEEFQLRGNYYSALSLIQSNQGAAAAQKLQSVLASSASSEAANRIKKLAEPMLAKALAIAGQIDEARQRALAIIHRENSENQELFAATYNVLGFCDLKSGNLNMAANKFLHTVLLFPIGEFHAEALYYLAKEVWPQLERADQAMESRETLRRLYPKSPWTAKLAR